MTSDQRKKLSEIKQFKQLIAYLRDEMGWPINSESEFDELTYEYTTTELGIDDKSAAQIQEIKRLRPLSAKQPWGVFFVKFEPKKLPVVALRRILGQVALKKRASANPADRTMWAQEDLLFISNYGEGDDRQITLAHFSVPTGGHTLPSLKVLGWDSKDTVLHLEAVARELTEQLSWPDNENDVEAWRAQWRAAFTIGHQEVITTSKALSIRLAQLARDIRDRISTALAIETEGGPLTKLMKAFQESLIHDLASDDFADMYAQTIAYGLLSSRIADPKKKSVDDLAVHMRLSPFLKELMETFLQVGGRNKRAGLDFDELGVGEVIDLLDQANMEAVVADFGDKNPEEDPVIHFYELFLQEYDAKKRMDRGVFYTPRPVVSYIVRSVDETLRKDFGLADGLADTATWGEMAKRNKIFRIPTKVSPDQDFVQILDPATGTGTFLVEAIDTIYKTLTKKWMALGHGDAVRKAMWNKYVPTHLLTRIHGFELMMAPYAIAHLKIGIKLYETGYDFSGNVSARVYLTNSLEPAENHSGKLAFTIPALATEANLVNAVKDTARFTVVIGNPPYAVASSNKGPWIAELCEPYKMNVRSQERQIQALSDDYVKFMRLMEWHIDRTDVGVLGIITNNGYLSGHLFSDLRQSLLGTFDSIQVLNLHGSSRLQERSPGGGVDENVFDIQTGVSILCGARSHSGEKKSLKLTDSWGTRAKKYSHLIVSNSTIEESIHLDRTNEPWIATSKTSKLEWDAMPGLLEVFGTGDRKRDAQKRYAAGFVSQQDDFAIAFSSKEIDQRIKTLLEPNMTESRMRERYKLCTTTQWNFDKARTALGSSDIDSLITECTYRPFDTRWTAFHRGVVTIVREEVMRHLHGQNNIALLATRGIGRQDFAHIFVTTSIVDRHALDNAGDSMFVFPLYIYPNSNIQEMQAGLFDEEEKTTNLSESFMARLTERWDKAEEVSPESVFYYIYAVLHSSEYRTRYKDFLKVDFPRLPIADRFPLFDALAKIGRELASIHVLKGLKPVPAKVAQLKGSDLSVDKIAWSNDSVWVDKKRTAGFGGIPEDVWNFHIGGYQVCEKWLKDRKGITLSNEDITHYRNIVYAVLETIRLMKMIDEVVVKFGGWPGAFQTIGNHN